MKYQIPLSNDLIIDNFAGGGGASVGIEMALERPINIAINHDHEALAMHEVNHPLTKHYCEDVWDVDPEKVCAGRTVALAWFSPDCKHFSKAKGGRPVEKKIRGLAWIVLRWVAKVRPLVIMLENVEEFTTWGPITEEGQPCPKRKGQTFNAFINALKRHGYNVEWRELRACDYGTPTIRKRLFLIARCDGLPIVWPKPTHGDPRKPDFKKSGLKPWRTAAECIDWSIPAPSIFERPRTLAENTLQRIAKGFKRYVMEADKPFIVPVCHSGSNSRSYDIDAPLTTITGKGEHAVVVPYMTEHANGSSQRVFDVSEPMRTQCAQVKGGHFALCMPFMAKHFGGVVGVSAETPLPTVTTRGTQTQLVSAYVSRMFGTSVGHDMYSPCGTATTKEKSAVVTAYINKMRGTNVGHGADEPLHTISAGGTHHTVTTAYMIKYYGNEKEAHGFDRPLGTVTVRDRFAVIQVASLTPETLSEEQRYSAWWTLRFFEDYGVVPKMESWDCPRPSFFMMDDMIVWDIGMRMLVPRELYRAQGFPENYTIDRTSDGKPITKTAQVRMCGNSVPPIMSKVLSQANIRPSALFIDQVPKKIGGAT